MRSVHQIAWTRSTYLRTQRQHVTPDLLHTSLARPARPFTTATRLLDERRRTAQEHDDLDKAEEKAEMGALSKRLSEMAEEAIDLGSKSDRKNMADMGFSEDLKKMLEEKIAQASFESQDKKSIEPPSTTTRTGQATRDRADEMDLRTSDDGRDRLRSPVRGSRPAPAPRTAGKSKNISAADRLASARDRTSIYAISQQADLTEEEREKMRKELKERFSPGARPVPATLQGLTSLANERIEDAIARGQFKNIQRGKGVNIERDYTANSPFLDTTEYFMNKIIQKQEIVPPWIEKQQELTKLVSVFRARLRSEWRRHAARSIASEGGDVMSQVRRAKSYALAEAIVNPAPSQMEKITSIDSSGTLRTITIQAKTVPVVESQKTEQTAAVDITVTESTPEEAPKAQPPSNTDMTKELTEQDAPDTELQTESAILPMPYPFRDKNWERIESAYHNLAVQELNETTRSYNLMAPKVAQKPYFTLQRELNRCYAEVAPLLADEILERSRKPKVRIDVIGHREGGIMNKFQGTGHVATVRDEDQKKGYGFKEFWRDLFRKDDAPQKRRTIS